LSQRRRLLGISVLGLSELLLLACGAFFTAQRQSQIARQQQVLATQNADQAKRYQARAELVTDIVMLELINSVNPYERGKVDAQVVDSLERMVAPISEKLASEPEFAALILQKLSTALVTGHQESAENAMRSAISHQRRFPRPHFLAKCCGFDWWGESMNRL
jgi:hypothetical protein